MPRRNFVTVSLPHAGLGHTLESYSRAFVYYASDAAEFVHPRWFKIRVGPYLRGELDKRQYHTIIRTPRSWGLSPIHGMRRWFNEVVSESTFDPAEDGQFLIVRDDAKHDFSRIEPYKEKFVAALHSLSRLPVRPRRGSPSIGIFHRSGDLRTQRAAPAGDERIRRTHGYGYIPPEYAAEALRKVRQLAGWDVPAVLSSDASPTEIDCILREPNISFARADSALANMLEMSQHDLLIVGSSSYGVWSWYLGDAFAVTPRLQNVEVNQLGLPHRESAYFVFADETSLNDDAIADRVRRLLARSDHRSPSGVPGC